MSEAETKSAMRRKLAPHRPPRQPGQATLELMLKKTMPRDADELLKMQIAVEDVAPGKQSKADILASLNPCDLIYLMKTDGGPPGVCILSPGLLSAIIEVQMSGKLSASEPGERTPTRTDGIVASDIVDRWISTARAEAEVQGVGELLPIRRYFRSEAVANARLLDLALDPGEFRTLTISLDMASGTRKGRMKFAVPPENAGARNLSRDAAQQFRENVMETEARLSVVLARLPKTIEEIARLRVGDVFEIPIESLLSVSLEDVNGEVAATGRLGQAGGLKAVRITSEDPEDDETPATREPFRGPSLAAGSVAALGHSHAKPDALPALTHQDDSGLPDLDGLPDLPDLPDLPGEDDFADLPDLSDLPDLPELPDLPDP